MSYSMFVAISSLSSSATSSIDGITWTLRTLPVSDNWYSTTYGNGLFLAFTVSGNEAYSTDGTTWILNTAGFGVYGVTSVPIQNNINLALTQGQFIGPITTPSYTVGPYDKYITFNTTATTTITLPNASLYINREIIIKQIAAFAVNSATSNVLSLASNTAGTAILAATAGKYATLVSDGNYWIIREAN